MANNKILVLPAVFLMALGSCVEPLDPKYNVPDILTGERVVSVSLHQVEIEAAPADYAYLHRFLEVDSTGAFQNPKRVERLQGDTLWIVSGLQTGTRYFYREGATDGMINRYGQVREFETLPAVGVSGLTLSVWNQTGNPVTIGGDAPFGFFYTDATTGKDENGMTNLPLTYDPATQQWGMPVEIEPTDVPHVFYVYSPYNAAYESKTQIPVGTADEDVDFLWGSSTDVTYNNYQAEITMHHVQAKVQFVVTRAAEDNVGSTFNAYALNSYEYEKGKNGVPVHGLLDVTTGQVQITEWVKTVWRYRTFQPSSEPVTLEFYVLPCSFVEMEFILKNASSNYGDVSAFLPSGSWEAGKLYTYPITVRQNQLEIGDVVVNAWSEIDAGSLVIYN